MPRCAGAEQGGAGAEQGGAGARAKKLPNRAPPARLLRSPDAASAGSQAWRLLTWWLRKVTSFQPRPPLIAKPASSPLKASFFIASAPTKYDIASSAVGRKGCSVALVGLKSTFVLP